MDRCASFGSGRPLLTDTHVIRTASGVPAFSPHDLRHRRASLLHLAGIRIGEAVGQRNLAVTANTYSHVMLDERALDYVAALASRSRGGA